MNRLARIYFVLLLIAVNSLSSQALLKRGFSALGEYDYFLAKKCFYKTLRKSEHPAANYGLAIIFSRRDNPFTNYDSAAKYINRSFSCYRIKPVSQNFFGFKIDSAAIRNLCDSIATRVFLQIASSQEPNLFDEFLSKNYLAHENLLAVAIRVRDELKFNEVIRKSHSDSTQLFICAHPESKLLPDAILLRQRQLYEEYTGKGRAEDYKKFIAVHPANIMVKEALENLFRIYKEEKNSVGLKNFIESYPGAPQVNDAWKLLFSLSVTTFSKPELEKFLLENPGFPFKHSIQKELQLNQLTLYPYEQNELYGFIDSTGKLTIKPAYESVTPFSEGLSVVSRNDSVFYINKENVNVFGDYFSEAYPFTHGMAAVKKNEAWLFINRQGQFISQPFEEINEVSSNFYIVKQNGKYGAANLTGQLIIEPRFQKLGDFKNDFAYYSEGTKYGFVSRNGTVHKAVYDWISDFSDGIATVKVSEQYGLINEQGVYILDPVFDLILRAPKNMFVVVKGGKYGFYSGKGCFLSAVAYDFQKEKAVEYYCNGTCFRLIKKSTQTLMDENGKQLTDFENFEEINFSSDGLYRVKKNKKYGFADKKLYMAIPPKYDAAADFSDSAAIVKIKARTVLIDISGKDIYSSENSLEKLSGNYYLEGTEEDKTLVNRKGLKILQGIVNVQRYGENRFIFTLNNGEIKLISD